MTLVVETNYIERQDPQSSWGWH